MMATATEVYVGDETFTAFVRRCASEERVRREAEAAASRAACAKRWEAVALVDLRNLAAEAAEALSWTFTPRHYRVVLPGGNVVRFLNPTVPI